MHQKNSLSSIILFLIIIAVSSCQKKDNSLNDLPVVEWRTVYYENMVRTEMGYPVREYYRSSQDFNTKEFSSPLAPRMLDSSNNPIFVAPPSIFLLIVN